MSIASGSRMYSVQTDNFIDAKDREFINRRYRDTALVLFTTRLNSEVQTYLTIGESARRPA